jgi:hypothetical protein
LPIDDLPAHDSNSQNGKARGVRRVDDRREFEKLYWREIEKFNAGNGHQMHHSMPIDAICTEACKRLEFLEMVEADIYRFRLGNKRRLWGFRRVNLFEILWYDPDHNVYPTDPD